MRAVINIAYKIASEGDSTVGKAKAHKILNLFSSLRDEPHMPTSDADWNVDVQDSILNKLHETSTDMFMDTFSIGSMAVASNLCYSSQVAVIPYFSF